MTGFDLGQRLGATEADIQGTVFQSQGQPLHRQFIVGMPEQ